MSRAEKRRSKIEQTKALLRREFMVSDEGLFEWLTYHFNGRASFDPQTGRISVRDRYCAPPNKYSVDTPAADGEKRKANQVDEDDCLR